MTTEIQTFATKPLGKPANIKSLMQIDEAAGALLDAMTAAHPDRHPTEEDVRAFVREAYLHIENAPEKAKAGLRRCTGDSVIQSLLDCIGCGFSLLPNAHEAYLIPFATQCTLMPGYRGLIKVCCESAGVQHVRVNLVYSGEDFAWWEDEHGPHWKHKPQMENLGDEKKLRGAYAVFEMASGPPIFEPMSKAELARVRRASKMSDGPAYKHWATEMYKKAPIRRGAKRLPSRSGRLLRAIEVDNQQYDIDGVREEQQARFRAAKQEQLAATEAGAGE